MTFLNPLLLFGMGAIAAPIIIHMIMNRRIKPVIWAAMQFLQASIQKNQKRINIEDWVLLALRCLILIFLALALARPAFNGKGGGAPLSKGSVTAIIALDNSYSMGQSDSSASRFDQARAAAEQVIDSLPAGSSVAILLFSDLVRAVIPEPTYDLNLARKVVRDAALSDRPTNIQTALKQALDTLSRHSASAQQIYLITDDQASGWKQFNEIVKLIHSPASPARSGELQSRVILVGNPEEHNLCVSDLRLASPMAAVGEAVELDVEVSNFGLAEAKDVAVRVGVDAESPCDEGVIASIPSKGSKRLTLFSKFRAAGYHTVTAQINRDQLACDDQRTIAVRATDDVRILLVDGGSATPAGNDAAQSASFYLRNALTPVPLSEREKYVVKTKTINPADLDSTNLADFEAVILADVAEITPASAEAISSYLTRGGGLIVFPGARTNASFYNATLGKKFSFLPAELGAIRGKPDQTDTFFSLQGSDYAHSIVSLWNDPSSGTLASAHFYRCFELKPDAGHTAQAGEAQVVLKFSDGTPAIMERLWGRGRVILFSSTANTAWNDLALRPSYLPLIDRTLGAILNRQNAQLNTAVGAPFEFVCGSEWLNKDAIVMPPGEKKGSGSLRRIGLQEGVPLLRFDETDKAGGYEATIKTEPPTNLKFAVQSNPAESDLAGLTAAQLASLAEVAQVIHWTPTSRLDEQIASKGGGSSGAELWIILAALVIVTACVELVVAGRFSASK